MNTNYAVHPDSTLAPISWAVPLTETVPLTNRETEYDSHFPAEMPAANLLSFDATLDFFPTEGFHPRLNRS